MWLSELTTPIAESDWDNMALGLYDSLLNSNCDFLRDTHTETDNLVIVTNDNVSSESVSLTSGSLLLD